MNFWVEIVLAGLFGLGIIVVIYSAAGVLIEKAIKALEELNLL